MGKGEGGWGEESGFWGKGRCDAANLMLMVEVTGFGSG